MHRVDVAGDVLLNAGDRVEYTPSAAPETGKAKAALVVRVAKAKNAPPSAADGEYLHGGEPVGGTINWFDANKHFGFLKTQFGGDDMFIHGNDVLPDQFPILAGAEVRFKVVMHRGRPKAVELGRAPVVTSYSAPPASYSAPPASSSAPPASYSAPPVLAAPTGPPPPGPPPSA